MFALVVLLAATACGRQAPPPPQEPVEPPKPQLLEHVVQYRGETLGLIARWYTGKTTNWQAIVEANPGLRPERINLGDTIMIPSEIVTNSEPLPSSAVRVGSTAKKMDPPTEAATESVTEEEPAVVGDAPAEIDGAEEEEVSVDALLGEIAAEREKRAEEAAKEAEAAAAKAEETVSVPEVETAAEEVIEAEEVVPEPSEVAAPSEVPADDDAAERERLLDELLSQ